MEENHNTLKSSKCPCIAFGLIQSICWWFSQQVNIQEAVKMGKHQELNLCQSLTSLLGKTTRFSRLGIIPDLTDGFVVAEVVNVNKWTSLVNFIKPWLFLQQVPPGGFPWKLPCQ